MRNSSKSKTKQELISENALLRERIREFEISDAGPDRETGAQAQAGLSEKKDEFESFFNLSLDLLCIADLDGYFRRLNPEWETALGYKLSELEGKRFLDLVHPDDLEATLAAVSELASGRQVLNFINRYLARDGTYRWIEWRSMPYENKLIYAAARDITEQKQAENALQRSEEKFFKAFNYSPNIMAIRKLKDGRFVDVNDAYTSVTGYSREELIGQSSVQIGIVNPETRERVMGVMRSQGLLSSEEVRIKTKTGDILTGLLSAVTIEIQGEPCMLTSFQDITDRKRMEESLKATLESIQDGFVSLDGEWRFVYVNVFAEKLIGMKRDELIGRSMLEVFPAALGTRLEHEFRIAAAGEVRNFDNFYKPWKRWFHNVCYPRASGGISVYFRDITELKRAEEALREGEERFHSIFDNSLDGIILSTTSGKILAANRAAQEMLGREEGEIRLGGRKSIVVSDEKFSKAINDREKTGKWSGELNYIRKDGTVFPVEVSWNVFHPTDEHPKLCVIFRDITERKRMEDQLIRAEKMEVLGRLAGGVAHDLNNVLGVLVGYSELLRESMPAESNSRKYADTILNSSVKGAAIIEDLLTLTRRGVAVSQVVDLNGLTSEILTSPEFEKMKSFHPGVVVRSELGDGLLYIKGSPVHLGKTLMNLIANSLESIPDRGEVVIKTENRYLDKPVSGYDYVKEGDYVVLTVSDSGAGISPDDLGRIFEPFYTKKVMGRSGTGLGLAVVWGTVKDHRGYIDVQSEKGKGSTFTLYFPVTREEMAAAENTGSLLACMGQGESILVVDDSTEQRDLAKRMLERLGYNVETAAGGEQAVEYLRKNKADLVVLDMIMDPGMDGLETYARIVEISPGQKAIIVSGFSESDRVRQAQELGAGAFVRKPYIMEKIGIAVRSELDKGE